MKLERLDLNLLLAFDVLASERSVTRAAARLGVSQPAMSGSLARLRLLFGDPLFVRSAGGMAPTARARQLTTPIGDALGRLRAALEPSTTFRPARSRHAFSLAATDYVEAVLLGPLTTAVRAAAPGVTLRTLRPGHAFVPPAELLREGSADLALGLYDELPRPRSELRAAPLGEERLVGLVRARRGRAPRRLTLREFARWPQIRIANPADARFGLIDALFRAGGLERRVALTVSNFASVPGIVADSELLGVLPERLARRSATALRLTVVQLPLATPVLSLAQVWHERRDRDPALVWLREAVRQVVTAR